MRRIGNHALWIGNSVDVSDLRLLHDVGIEALVDLGLNEPVPVLTRELIYCRFPLLDGVGNPPALLRLAVETTARLIGAEVPPLVFCSAGMSRSPAVAAVALAKATQMSVVDCLTTVFADGPRDLSGGLWNDLLRVHGFKLPTHAESSTLE
jgi:protein-tyrosine phosphatase